jgi:hypothetical protein
MSLRTVRASCVYIGVVCGIDIDVVSQYMVYDSVYYCDTYNEHLAPT